MNLTCPACGKREQNDETCARCGCDLSQLQNVLRSAAGHLGAGWQALRTGDWPVALGQANASWRLCHTDAAARLAFLAASALGDTRLALGWREQARRRPL